jgi:hypothetical protein
VYARQPLRRRNISDAAHRPSPRQGITVSHQRIDSLLPNAPQDTFEVLRGPDIDRHELDLKGGGGALQLLFGSLASTRIPNVADAARSGHRFLEQLKTLGAELLGQLEGQTSDVPAGSREALREARADGVSHGPDDRDRRSRALGRLCHDGPHCQQDVDIRAEQLVEHTREPVRLPLGEAVLD